MDRTLLSVLAGLGGMFGWGISDFFANISSEKIGHTKTLFWSQCAGIAVILGAILLLGIGLLPSGIFLVLTIVAGVSYAVGYLYFYTGFEIGNVSVVSAVINLQTVFIMAISFFLRGQSLTIVQFAAICMLMVGILLVSVNFAELRSGTVSLLSGVKETLIAAVFFGVLYWPLNELIVENASWLMVTLMVKLSALASLFIISLWKKENLRLPLANKKLILLLVSIGVLETLGILSANIGQAYGDGIIVAPISSALTLVTVSLAVIFLKEKISRIQAAGIALAVAGIILTAL